ncbi:head-tail connector protein [Bacillus mojavensis]|uniref:head-tail connector protein n=1 Tax=Bacillus subtilis group TaxID=653685 RepID=UPI002DB56C75|nr:head-tail connector protein [Bacillus mojavensis]MEC1709837.1 head-tail connector protein [Bacillus mojavensis]
MTLEDLKLYLRVNHNFHDTQIKLLQAAAESYVKDAVTLSENRESYFTDNPKFELATSMLIGHWYENGSATAEKQVNEVPFGVINLIQQMRGAYIDGLQQT